MTRLRLREAVVVEGKHDRIRLEQAVDAPIVVTNGFRIFHDRERVAWLRQLAAARGLILFTDSDAAGFLIRRRLSGMLPPQQVKQAYCPAVPGRERRKSVPSKEGLLGVEGIAPQELAAALRRAGATVLGGTGEAARAADAPPAPWLTTARMMEDGLVGGNGSAAKRAALLAAMGLPSYLSAARLREVLNLTADDAAYRRWLAQIDATEKEEQP